VQLAETNMKYESYIIKEMKKSKRSLLISKSKALIRQNLMYIWSQ
jgi:hypothetical protein